MSINATRLTFIAIDEYTSEYMTMLWGLVTHVSWVSTPDDSRHLSSFLSQQYLSRPAVIITKVIYNHDCMLFQAQAKPYRRTYTNSQKARVCVRKAKSKARFHVAIYHCSVKIIARSKGQNAVKSAAYRAGERLICARTGAVFDYTRKTEVSHREILVPANSPSWAQDRNQLWNEVEANDTRKNSQLARELEVALPIELTPERHQRLLHDFLKREFADQGLAVDLAIHNKPGNPHAHVMVSLRNLSATGFGEKRRDLNGKATLFHWRRAWADHVNRALADAGLNIGVDERSLIDQGVNRVPGKHLGPAAIHFERRTGQASRRRLDYEREVVERLLQAKAAGELERLASAGPARLIDTVSELSKTLTQERPKLGGRLLAMRAEMGLEPEPDFHGIHNAGNSLRVFNQMQSRAESAPTPTPNFEFTFGRNGESTIFVLSVVSSFIGTNDSTWGIAAGNCAGWTGVTPCQEKSTKWRRWKSPW